MQLLMHHYSSNFISIVNFNFMAIIIVENKVVNLEYLDLLFIIDFNLNNSMSITIIIVAVTVITIIITIIKFIDFISLKQYKITDHINLMVYFFA